MRIRISCARHGSVLLTALLTTVIIGLALGSYLWVVSNQNQSVMRSLAWNSAIPVVEAGLEEALTQLYYTDIDHLSANGWTDVGNGWYSKQHHVDDRSYYDYDFVGACVVNTIKLNGHNNFHFDEALMKALWNGYVAVAWNEIDPNAPIN